MLVGGVTGGFSVFFVEENTWPTHEMESRGDPWGLLTGCAIAIPSGMAVALSILRYATEASGYSDGRDPVATTREAL